MSGWVPPTCLLRTSVCRHSRHTSSSRLLSGLPNQCIMLASPWVDSARLDSCLDYRRLALVSSRVVHGGIFRHGCRPFHTSYRGDILVVPFSRRPGPSASIAVSPRMRLAYARKEQSSRLSMLQPVVGDAHKCLSRTLSLEACTPDSRREAARK